MSVLSLGQGLATTYALTRSASGNAFQEYNFPSKSTCENVVTPKLRSQNHPISHKGPEYSDTPFLLNCANAGPMSGSYRKLHALPKGLSKLLREKFELGRGNLELAMSRPELSIVVCVSHGRGRRKPSQ